MITFSRTGFRGQSRGEEEKSDMSPNERDPSDMLGDPETENFIANDGEHSNGNRQGVRLVAPEGTTNNGITTVHNRRRRRIAADARQNRVHEVPVKPGHPGGHHGHTEASGTAVATDSNDSDEDAMPHHVASKDAFHHLAQKRIVEPLTAYKKLTWYDWASTLLPCLRWLKVYNWQKDIFNDLIAGVSVGIMVVPQSMSYAKLAGLPVEYGLYSALVPVYAYALFGSSRQLAVGPVALVSLMLSTGLTHVMERTTNLDEILASGEFGDDGERMLAGGTGASPSVSAAIEANPELRAKYNALAVQAAFLVGVMYIIMGIFRLGFVTIFLSHAVVSGFTTGAAVIIGISQLKYIVGYDVERSDRLYEVVHNVIKGIDGFNYKTFIVGMASILTLVLMKKLGKAHPKFKFVRTIGPLTVTAFTIALTYIFQIDKKGVPIVSSIPSGFPALTMKDWLPLDSFSELFPTVASIAVVGFMESIAIAKQLAAKHKYELDSSLELIGLGMANFAGAMFQSYPVTGSFSRSAVSNDSGAKSGVAAIITATLVMLVLLLLTPIFEKLPLSVLAAIVISGVLGLLDYPEAMYLWRVHKFDFAVWMTAFLGTMFLGVEVGLVIAVGVSLLLVTYESAYPHTAVLGRLPGTTVYRNVKQYPEAESYDGIVIVRIDAPIYFANTQNVREKLSKYERAALAQSQAKAIADRATELDDSSDVFLNDGQTQPKLLKSTSHGLKYMLLELSPVSHVDTSALHIIHDLVDDYKNRGITLCLCNPNENVMEKFSASGLLDVVGPKHIFCNVHDAVDYALRELDALEVSLHTGGQGGTIEEENFEDDDNDLPSDIGKVVITTMKGDLEAGMVAAKLAKK